MLRKYLNSKQKICEIKDYALCLDNISNNFKIDNMKKNRIRRSCTVFSVDFILLVLMIFFNKKAWYKIMFGLIKRTLTGLLTGIVSASNHTNCIL